MAWTMTKRNWISLPPAHARAHTHTHTRTHAHTHTRTHTHTRRSGGTVASGEGKHGPERLRTANADCLGDDCLGGDLATIAAKTITGAIADGGDDGLGDDSHKERDTARYHNTATAIAITVLV